MKRVTAIAEGPALILVDAVAGEPEQGPGGPRRCSRRGAIYLTSNEVRLGLRPLRLQ